MIFSDLWLLIAALFLRCIPPFLTLNDGLERLNPSHHISFCFGASLLHKTIF